MGLTLPSHTFAGTLVFYPISGSMEVDVYITRIGAMERGEIVPDLAAPRTSVSAEAAGLDIMTGFEISVSKLPGPAFLTGQLATHTLAPVS